MKKIIGLFLGILILITPSFAEFTDVTEDYWGYSAINRMEKAGILSGYYDGTFKPGNYITLGEFSVIFTKIFEIPQDNISNYFLDVPTDHWAKGYIEAVREYINPYYDSIGEALGVTDYSYLRGLPGDIEVTREAFIYAVSKIYGYSDDAYVEGEEKTLFADYQDILYPKEVVIAYKNNIIAGEKWIDGKTYIRPKRCISRAEASAIFNNLLKYENRRVTNKGEEAQLNPVFSNIIKILKTEGVTPLKNHVYDTQGVLNNSNFVFNQIEEAELNEFCKSIFENFEYEIVDRGFYSFNRGYIKVKTKGYDLLSNIEDITAITSERIQEIKSQIANREIIVTEKEETINFAKQSGEWKLIIK